MQIILYRALAASVIGLLLLGWFYPLSSAMQQALMLAVGFGSALLLLLQLALNYSQRVAPLMQWVFQYASDTILVSVLILASGGISSPFSFLLGVIVIASGIHAQQLLPLLISTVSCIAYLTAVHTELWMSHSGVLSTSQALHVLLQVSALLLVGGVMAFIARRHASLSASSDQAVRQHRLLKDLHDKIMAEMREGVILLNQQLHAIDSNEAAKALLKRESLADLLLFPPLADFFHQAQLQSPAITSFQCEYDRHNQILLLAVRRLSIDNDAVWLLTIVDTSEVRQLQEQLIQQEKMAALGKMAAMLAHEIRNPIQTMAQCFEIMGKRPANASQMQHIFHDEAQRLNRLVNVMLQYSKPLHANMARTLMRALIKASVQQFDGSQTDRSQSDESQADGSQTDRSQADRSQVDGSQVDGGQQQVQWQLEVDELYLDGDHFRLVLDNLLSNALLNSSEHASPVTVSLRVVSEHWILQVCNQGEISLDVRDKLFEPFISGRPAGIGLGLATVQQVCMVNGWQVEISTETGLVCFTIRGAMQQPKIEQWNQDLSTQQRLEAGHG